MSPQPWCRVLVLEHGEGLWGAQRYLLRLAPLLAERGVEQVLAAPAASATARAWSTAGGRHVVLDVPAERSLRSPSGRLAPALALREIVRSGLVARRTARLVEAVGADVLHANSHWSHLEAVGAARLTHRPVVLHLHEQSEPDLLGRLRALAVLAAEASIGVSAAVAQSLPPRAAARVTVIRNGIDVSALAPGAYDPAVRAVLTSDPGAPVVLVLARLDPRKGIDDVIRAVAGLPDHLQHTRLAVAGTSSLDPQHGATLRDLGAELLGDRVRFLGLRSDVRDMLRAADVLVLASTQEGLPLSVLEAQACGLPVVAYPTSGIPEVVEHGTTGLLARQGDVRDLTRQIARVVSEPELAARLSRAARAQVVREGTLERQADEQVALLRRLLRRPPVRVPA